MGALFLWSIFTHEDNGSTGSAVFDFDGDGKVEVVYGDSSRLHNNDGSNPQAPSYTCDGALNAGLRVFSSASSSWVRTRRVWNQHT